MHSGACGKSCTHFLTPLSQLRLGEGRFRVLLGLCVCFEVYPSLFQMVGVRMDNVLFADTDRTGGAAGQCKRPRLLSFADATDTGL